MRFIDEEIENQRRYVNQAKTELEGFKELAEAFEMFAIGFTKIARFAKSISPHYEDRIAGHTNRIKELELEKAAAEEAAE
jgi:predicted chitinase